MSKGVKDVANAVVVQRCWCLIPINPIVGIVHGVLACKVRYACVQRRLGRPSWCVHWRWNWSMVNPCHLGGMRKCAARRNASKIVFCFEGHAEKMRERGCILAFWILTLPNRAVGLCFVMVCSFFKLVEKGGPDSSARLYAKINQRGKKQGRWKLRSEGYTRESTHMQTYT